MQGKGGSVTAFPMMHTKVDVPPPSGSSHSFANPEDPDTKGNICTTCTKGIDLVTHVAILCLTIFTLCYSLSTIDSFTLHVTLCTIGYVLLMSEAIVLLAGDSILTNFLTHSAKRHVHWILQVLGGSCTFAGVAFIFREITDHFDSTHAILGITSVSMMLFLTALGYPTFIAVKLRKMIRPVVIKFCHNFLGMSCFAIGMAAQCYGYKKYRALNISDTVDVSLICVIVTGIIAILSVRKALPTLFQQFIALFR